MPKPSQPEPIRIRPFRPLDAPLLCDLHRRALLALPDAIYAPQLRTLWADGLRPEGYLKNADKGEIFHVAEQGGEVLGFCGHLEGAVCGLYVDPDHQGKGIGAQLLANAERQLATDGAPRIEVNASLNAVPFYRAKGYEVQRDTLHTTRLGAQIAGRLMTKSLV